MPCHLAAVGNWGRYIALAGIQEKEPSENFTSWGHCKCQNNVFLANVT